LFELKDRSDCLFGRGADLELLKQRAKQRGLTAVIARPQMGKSWLLTELARQLSQSAAVGFSESYGESADLMLRAIVDLYQRRLADTTFWQQAKLFWRQNKDKLLPGLAAALGRIAEGATVPAASVVKEAIEGLVGANETLKSGGVRIPTLMYEQAQSLIQSVFSISEQPICLFFDQWEQSLDPALEGKTIRAFLSHIGEWPPCHIFLALRDEDGESLAIVNDLVQQYPAAQSYPLREMRLGDDGEKARLLRFLHECIPAVRNIDGGKIIDLISGYPGVIYRWIEENRLGRIATANDLDEVADDAQAYRFRELQGLLKNLSVEQRNLAIRIALVPSIANPQTLQALRGAIMEQIPDSEFDELRNVGILETSDPPSYGHPKRMEAVVRLLISDYKPSLRSEGEALGCAWLSRFPASIEGTYPPFRLLRHSRGTLVSWNGAPSLRPCVNPAGAWLANPP
jgi:hypothetical protein